MKKSILTAALASAALAATPLAAQAQSRTAAPVADESEIGGSPIAGLIGLAVVGLLATVLITDTGDDDDPVSA